MIDVSVIPLEFEDRANVGRMYPSQTHIFVDVAGDENRLNRVTDIRAVLRDGLTGADIVSGGRAFLISNGEKGKRRIPVSVNIADYRQRGSGNVAALRVELFDGEGTLLAKQNFAVDNDHFEPAIGVTFKWRLPTAG